VLETIDSIYVWSVCHVSVFPEYEFRAGNEPAIGLVGRVSCTLGAVATIVLSPTSLPDCHCFSANLLPQATNPPEADRDFTQALIAERAFCSRRGT